MAQSFEDWVRVPALTLGGSFWSLQGPAFMSTYAHIDAQTCICRQYFIKAALLSGKNKNKEHPPQDGHGTYVRGSGAQAPSYPRPRCLCLGCCQ